MTAAESARYLALKDSSNNLLTEIVSTGDIKYYQTNDTLVFQIPGGNDTLIAVASKVVQNSSSDFSWYGSLIPFQGYMALHYKDNQVFGFVQSGTSYYELLPMNGTYQYLVKRNTETQVGCGTPSESLAPTNPPIDPECNMPGGFDPYNTCPAVVTVLLVITNEAKTWILQNYGSIAAFAHEGEGLVNQALLNSDIPNKVVKLRWIERNYSLLLSSPADIVLDLQQLDDLLEFDRNAELADVAFLVTNQEYGNVEGAVFEIGVNKDNAYGIIEAPYFNGAYTFPHELGHIFGCRHNWYRNLGNDDTNVIAHAYRHFFLPQIIDYEDVNEISSWRSLLAIGVYSSTIYILQDEDEVPFAVQITNSAQILHYSNPDVNFGQVPTGNSCANNAAQIRNGACEVADFFDSQELSVFISNSNSPCGSLEYTAMIVEPSTGLQGTPPYTVSWSWSSNGNFGNNTETFLGTGQVLTLTNHPRCPVYWLKCTVTSADEIVVTAIKKIVMAWTCCTDIPDPEDDELGRAIPKRNNIEIYAYPNPGGTNGIFLNTTMSTTEQIDYKISNTSGKIIQKGNLMLDGGKAWIDTRALEPGFYFLNAISATGDQSCIKLCITK